MLQSKFDFTLYRTFIISSIIVNKIIYLLDGLNKKTPWKSSRLIYKCSNFVTFDVILLNSSRP